jgi:hypothetical protein
MDSKFVDRRKGDWVVPELNASELSKDMRFLVFEAAGPGIANSPSKAGFGRGVLLPYRCDRVDFLKDGVFRAGDWLLVAGEENEKVTGFSLSFERRGSSPEERGVGPCSNTSKSAPKVDAPTLRLFATGLPIVAESRFMIPSLRFKGLDLAGIKQLAPGAPGRANSNLIGLSSMS